MALSGAGVAVFACSSSPAANAGCTGGTPCSDDAGGDTITLSDSGADVEAGRCPSARGSAMVVLPGSGAGTYCIDSTEVTNAQYAAFLADKNGDTSGQIPECGWNSSFQPGSIPGCHYDPVNLADYPVNCVNWCDAAGFCSWAGKRLCGPFKGTSGAWADAATDDEWMRACTSAAQFDYVYGNTQQSGRCDDNAHASLVSIPDAMALPVGSLPGCQSPDPQYAGVLDLIGSVAEWNTRHDQASPHQHFAFGSSYGFADMPCRDPGTAGWNILPDDAGSFKLGFRCCAD